MCRQLNGTAADPLIYSVLLIDGMSAQSISRGDVSRLTAIIRNAPSYPISVEREHNFYENRPTSGLLCKWRAINFMLRLLYVNLFRNKMARCTLGTD